MTDPDDLREDKHDKRLPGTAVPVTGLYVAHLARGRVSMRLDKAREFPSEIPAQAVSFWTLEDTIVDPTNQDFRPGSAVPDSGCWTAHFDSAPTVSRPLEEDKAFPKIVGTRKVLYWTWRSRHCP